MVRTTTSLAAIGAALLLFSSPIDIVFTGFPFFRLSTIALSVESGVNKAPSAAVSGRAATLPGSN